MSSPLNFFYSYCHADSEQRAALEKHLSMLVRNKVISPWHDADIVAGSDWKRNIVKNLEEADIVVFLVTTSWLGSEACIEEWELAKKSSEKQPNKVLIPVIATDCAWLDFDDMKSKLVLPYDGNPVSKWDDADSAWLNVYNGIKKAAEEQKKKFRLLPSYVDELQAVEFCSTNSKEIILEDIFVFPNLLTYSEKTDGIEIEIDGIDDLIKEKRQFIIGDSQSGKTKLSAWLCLELNKQNKSCLYFDLNQLSN
ncbi:toll/interleukin-1 receptor domain-containing protein, partial [Psychromonas antarctica]|uniref:toll/interleukin-1 receptor domain-containing protein n=1 Tax=Psychromonas antarctica TaxID=67573 RepID=UPI001EE99C84